ncbi:RNA polymerase factor sigma-54 [Burkholderia sp. FERM BP-3421]|jgi:RNA polymerase sigma-54 factor|uniref:RNA polymerase factor sigma-54 n=1 Tax=Burkholderia sp. FERM BP-3421 TaxID=1494466 RepID=UPI002361D04F|nr:RNA polymerase factor sigma-54 [Burkholderia sp. FERM BP-3421]WDD90955.1 RNA polymerase factor sigma-54 [Burkholderia sp. FERM BP-3421]
MSLSLGLQMRQHLALTPRLQQSLRLLQLSSLEFQQEWQQALDNNPFLEDTRAPDEAAKADDAAVEPDSPTRAESPDTATVHVESGRGVDAADAGHADTAPRGGRSGGEAVGLEPGEWNAPEPSLRAHLHEALRLQPLSGRDRAAAHMIVDALDDDGYLRQSLADLVRVVEPGLGLDEGDLAVALRRVQSLERPGIGARSLAECLLLQLDDLPPDTPALACARAVVQDHLECLARREMADLRRRLDCDARTLDAACALVRRLDPRPGNQYGSVRGEYVVPDVIVRQIRGDWIVMVNPDLVPCVRIHRRYAALFARERGARDSLLGQQLQEAHWLLRNARKRFDTIQRVGACIVERQRDFFRHGERALKPMILRDIAEALDLHESTVSRATGNKYMATPHGTFEFKYFFPRKLEAVGAGVGSAAAAKALIRELIADEAARAPWSDVALAKALAARGIVLARRTVTKYRQAMRIPAADLRRRMPD